MSRSKNALTGLAAGGLGLVLLFGLINLVTRRAPAPAEIFEFQEIRAIVADPFRSEFLYLATPIGPVTLAWDGNWRKAGSDRYDLTALAASPSRPGRLYAAGRPPAGTQLPDPLGLIRSQDGGRTWLLVSGQGRLAFTALAAGRGPEGDVLYGWDAAGRTLLHSDDGGFTWTERSSPAQEVHGLAVHPDEPLRLAAAAADGVRISEDGGLTWRLERPGGPVTAVGYAPGGDASPAVLHAYVDGEEPGLWRRPDGGEWERVRMELDLEEGERIESLLARQDGLLYMATGSGSLLQRVPGELRPFYLARGGVPAVQMSR